VAEGEERPNLEWQEHMITKEISGQMVCLDCPKNETEKEVRTW